MDNLYVHCQLAINRFSSREKNFVTHKQQCLQAVDCNDIRFQDGKRIHTLGAQSVHTRWASYFSNILRFWVYLFLENNTICHLRVFGSFVKQKINPNSYLLISCPLSSGCWIWIKTVCLLHAIDGS